MCEDEMQDDRDDGGDTEDALEVLGSSRGERSLASRCRLSMVVVGVAAFVRIVGSDAGARRGDNGGVSAGSAMRPEEVYSTA